jgi:outer membrane protein assembly factor BamB
VANGIVYTEAYPHTEYAVSSQTGKTLWTYTSNSLVDGSAVVVNNQLYLDTGSGGIATLGLAAHSAF